MGEGEGVEGEGGEGEGVEGEGGEMECKGEEGEVGWPDLALKYFDQLFKPKMSLFSYIVKFYSLHKHFLNFYSRLAILFCAFLF